MIEIKCSKKEKQKIINSLLNPDGCLFPRKRKRCSFDKNANCMDCFENDIKWINQQT